MAKQFYFKQFKSKTVLFQAIRFSISTQFSSIRPIDRIVSGQSGPESDAKEGVLCIPQSSSIVGTSPSDCLVSYPGDSLGEVLTLCREAVGVFHSPPPLRRGSTNKGKQNILYTPQT